MKWLMVLLGSIIILAGVVGCGNTDRASRTVKTGHVEQTEQFPEVMVGYWQAENGRARWAFKLEPDGSISEITHYIAGEVNLREGGTYLDLPEKNISADFVMGPCDAVFNADTKELKVSIVLDYYRMQALDAVLEGRSEDYFRGHISENGKKWHAVWQSHQSSEVKTLPVRELPLTFKKIPGN